MVKPFKIFQLYRFIKFPQTKIIGHNITMMPGMGQDLLVVGEDYQYKLMDQANFLSCKQYSRVKTVMLLVRTEATTCIGAYYLQNLTSIANSTWFLQRHTI